MDAGEHAKEWFYVHFSHREAPVAGSGLLAAEESPAGVEGWLFEIPEADLRRGSRIYLLCQAENDPEDYYVLAIPTRTLQDMGAGGQVTREKQSIRLLLEAGDEHQFVDRHNGAHVDFSRYQVWPEHP